MYCSIIYPIVVENLVHYWLVISLYYYSCYITITTIELQQQINSSILL